MVFESLKLSFHLLQLFNRLLE